MASEHEPTFTDVRRRIPTFAGGTQEGLYPERGSNVLDLNPRAEQARLYGVKSPGKLRGRGRGLNIGRGPASPSTSECTEAAIAPAESCAFLHLGLLVSSRVVNAHAG